MKLNKEKTITFEDLMEIEKSVADNFNGNEISYAIIEGKVTAITYKQICDTDEKK